MQCITDKDGNFNWAAVGGLCASLGALIAIITFVSPNDDAKQPSRANYDFIVRDIINNETTVISGISLEDYEEALKNKEAELRSELENYNDGDEKDRVRLTLQSLESQLKNVENNYEGVEILTARLRAALVGFDDYSALEPITNNAIDSLFIGDLTRASALIDSIEQIVFEIEINRANRGRLTPVYFQTRFETYSFDANLIDIFGTYKKSGSSLRNTGARNYIRTKYSSYAEEDFVAVLTYTLEGGGGPAGVFFGLGEARKNTNFYDEPFPSVFLIDLPNDFVVDGKPVQGTGIRKWASAGSTIGSEDNLFYYPKAFRGLARVSITKIGDEIEFSGDMNFNGSSFEKDMSKSFDIKKVAPFLDSINSSIFFGTGHEGVEFHSLMIKPMKQKIEN